VYLTIAGATLAAIALVRTDRRELGWLGGALLAMASWVRLADIGVHAPEAYTLPSATALLVVGVVALRRRHDVGSLPALSAGLALGLVPSLLWVLDQPATWRALLLGVACLVLLGAGLRLRWSAPVVYAAGVGALVVLRQAAPFVDAAVPRWILIGLAGAVLIGVGITWERRVAEVRALLGFVRRLR
jgi:hypothetical protein